METKRLKALEYFPLRRIVEAAQGHFYSKGSSTGTVSMHEHHFSPC